MPSNLQIATLPNELDVTLTWTNPVLNTDGTALTSLNGVGIYRNDVLVADLSDMLPGAAVEYSETVPVQDDYRYRIAAYTDIEGMYCFTREKWIGPPVYALPTGPDAYGYVAYDIYDEPEGPEYLWMEISADSGGPGTMVNFTVDDQIFHYELPFMFQYYGLVYDSLSIATNGWIAPGVVREEDYSNSGIPDADGPPGMIAPYWEDLSPQRTNSGKVWRWYDETNHRYIVEYNHIEQWAPVGAFETFEVILLDPEYYQTVTGDGQIIFQYKQVSTSVHSEGTVGIENHDATIGIQYLFDGTYDEHAVSLEAGIAVLYTTMTSVPAMGVELTYLSGSPVPASGGYINFDVFLQNNETSTVNFDLWIEIPPQITPPSVPNRNLTFPAGHSLYRPGMPWPIPASWPAGNYDMVWNVGNLASLTVWATDSFPFEKSAISDGSGFTLWEIEGDPLDQLFAETNSGESAVVSEFTLLGVYPNPFNPTTVLSYKLQDASFVNLTVYDINGRQVAELVNGWRDMGVHEVTFDGANLSSGVYIYRLEAGDYHASGKMVLMK